MYTHIEAFWKAVKSKSVFCAYLNVFVNSFPQVYLYPVNLQGQPGPSALSFYYVMMFTLITIFNV